MNFQKAVLLAESRYYNKVLHPAFWSNNIFDQSIRKKLLEIVQDFFGEPESIAQIDDIQLTGSMANYNYTKHSDLDVHILIDFSKINEDMSIVKRALDGKRFIWNLRHNIQIRGHEVELYYQHTNEPHVASGLYSLKNNEWITTPKYSPPDIDERDVLKKAEGITDIINRISVEVEKDISPGEAKEWHTHAKKIKDKLAKLRSAGLRREGEFSIENLSFKELRNNGSIGKLIDTISSSYSKIYSEEAEEPIEEIIDLNYLFNKENGKTSKPERLKGDEAQSYTQLSHRGINRQNQSWVPDSRRITKADLDHQKVERSKEDNISRMITGEEAIRAAVKYGIDINNIRKGHVKELGTSKTKMWFDGKNFFIQGTK